MRTVHIHVPSDATLHLHDSVCACGYIPHCDACYENAADHLENNAELFAAGPRLRAGSQEFYDRVQDYLDVADSELPASLVAAMNELEATWRAADGNPPDPTR